MQTTIGCYSGTLLSPWCCTAAGHGNTHSLADSPIPLGSLDPVSLEEILDMPVQQDSNFTAGPWGGLGEIEV